MDPRASDLLDRVRHFIEAHGLMAPGARVLVGVSGGIDSVVLLHALVRLGYRVSAAHLDYGLRGAASTDDASFVAALCRELDVRLFTLRCDAKTYAGAQRQSIQAAARELRYAFFAEVAGAERISRVAVAHHRDDQAETLLLNLFRGSGPEGLAAMRASRRLVRSRRVRLVRPLLGVRRDEIEAHARAVGITWREDASNVGSKYRRNVVRHVLLPLVEEHFGSTVIDRIARSADLLREYADALRSDLIVRFGEVAVERRLTLDRLRAYAPVWQRRLILEALARWLPGSPRTAAVAAEILRLLDAEAGACVALGTGTIWRERDALVFRAAEETTDAETVAVIGPGEVVATEVGCLRIDLLSSVPPDLTAGSPLTVYADAERLVFPLLLRCWRPGDRFRPLGMAGSKSVSDLLTDAKAPVHERSKVPLLLSEESIVWVVGYRLDERFRVGPTTRQVAKITLIPG